MDGEVAAECDVCGQNHITEDCPMLGLSTSDFKAQISRSVKLGLWLWHPATFLPKLVWLLVVMWTLTAVSWKNIQRAFSCWGQNCCSVCIEFIDFVFRSVVYFQINCLHPVCSKLGLCAIMYIARVAVLCRALVKTKSVCVYYIQNIIYIITKICFII